MWLEAPMAVVDRLTMALGAAGIPIRGLNRERHSLEDLFFRLTEDPAE